ncbi:MAG: transporter substrate-binding domain-containing protein [Micropruina glycogenica]
MLYDFAKQNPTTKVATEFATGEHYGFNMAKDNTALLTVVNEVLKTAKSDGTYNDTYKRSGSAPTPQGGRRPAIRVPGLPVPGGHPPRPHP